MSLRIKACLLTILVLGAVVVAAERDCQRVIAVGDLHGGIDAFIAILQRTGLIDEAHRWQGDKACLVQLGDVVDRGPRSREILDFLIELQAQAPQRVLPLIGNHEALNIVGDLRYVTAGEFAAFAAEELEQDRAAGFQIFYRYAAPFARDQADLRRAYAEAVPPGWFGHRRAFAPQGRYGAWLLERQGLVVIDGTLLVHGGIALHDARKGIDQLNSVLSAEIREFHRLHQQLVARGVLNPFAILRMEVERLRLQLAAEDRQIDPELAKLAESFIATYASAAFRRKDGPLWHRELAESEEEGYAATLEELLRILAVERIVVGHTTVESAEISTRFNDRVFMIDTGAGPAYTGQVSALELTREGPIWAHYLDRSELLVDPRPTGSSTESFAPAAKAGPAGESDPNVEDGGPG